jgi:serine/threonine protein kinase
MSASKVTQSKPTTASEVRLVEVLDAYLAAAQEGQAPGRDELLAEHPELAADLEACLASLEFIGRARVSVPPLVADLKEVDAGESGPGIGDLGDFRLVAEVGRGGMGVVYEAVQRSLNRRVALKVLPFAAAMDATQRRRFQTEALAAAQLHHTHIVPVYSVGCERGVHYYAMQFIQGQTLAQLMVDRRRLENQPQSESLQPDQPIRSFSPSPSSRSREFIRTAAALGIQAAEALDHAHKVGIVHRDIKPANLLLDVQGSLWVTDFGLARLQDDAGLTITGDLLGTLRYMSPEQALAKRGYLDHRTDIYSLDATVYELLTSRPAIEGDNRQEVLRKIAYEEPTSPRKLNPAIPRELETILLKAMSKEPQSRYMTAQELADDLRRFLDNKPIKANRPSLVEHVAKWARRHTSVVAAAFAMLITVVGALLAITLLVAREQRNTVVALKATEFRSRQARRVVDTMYTRVAEEWLSQKSDLEPLQRVFLQEALDFYRQLVSEQEQNRDPSVREETARTYDRVAELESRFGRMREAEAAFRSTIAIQESLAADQPTTDHRLDVEVTWKKLSGLLFQSGRYKEAEEILVRVRSKLETLAASEPLQIKVRERLADANVVLAGVWGTVGRRDEADSTFGQALELFQSLVDSDPLSHRYRTGLANCLRGLGTTASLRGEYAAARAQLDRAVLHRRNALEIKPVDKSLKQALADDLLLLGEILDHANELDLAQSALKEAATVHGELASEFPNVPAYAAANAKAQYSLGNLYETLRRISDAVRLLQQAGSQYTRLRKRYPESAEYRFQEAGLRYNLARMLQNMGRAEDSEREIRIAVGLFEEFLLTSPTHNQAQAGLATSLHVLGNSLAALVAGHQRTVAPDRLTEARNCLERSIETSRKVLQTEPKNRVGRATLQGAHMSLSEALTLSGQYDEARERCASLARIDESPSRGSFEALEAVDNCLSIVKSATGLDSAVRERQVRAFVTLGEAYRRQAFLLASEKSDEADELVAGLAFRLAFRFNPELRDPVKSLTLARSLAARKPESNTAWGVVGVAFYCSDRVQSAREALLKAVALNNSEFEIYMFTAMSVWKCGDRDGARQWYRRAMRQWDETLSSDEWIPRLRAEAAAVLGITDDPSPGGKNEKEASSKQASKP